MYNVTIKHYGNRKETSIPVASFHDALRLQEGASAVAGILNWTRHDNYQDIVCHMDMVHDLYNEGSITVNPV